MTKAWQQDQPHPPIPPRAVSAPLFSWVIPILEAEGENPFRLGTHIPILFLLSSEKDFVPAHSQAVRKQDAQVPCCGFGFHQPVEVVEVVVHRGFLLC